MTSREALVATTRFGLGPRPGELALAAGDPKGWLLAQLTGPIEPLATSEPLPDGRAAMLSFMQGREGEDEALRRQIRREGAATWRLEAATRTRHAIRTARPILERWVLFWSSHLTVSARQRPVVAGLVGAFEREAIRPNVLGSFHTLLRATATHQAMLVYLDNVRSVGPASTFGQRRGSGLNENYARELLELHTLGVDGGYRQADVTELARILTGWSVAPRQRADGGAFAFLRGVHEPGAKRFLERDYQEAGMAEGEQALSLLATHPATARHIATKLARHFVADEPPPAVVQRLTEAFMTSGGDLAHLAQALVTTPEALALPLVKIRTGNDYLVACLRALDHVPEDPNLVRALTLLGQPPFGAPSPAGWPDTALDWSAPDMLLQRLEWAASLAARHGASTDPEAIFEGTIAPVADVDSRRAILGAGSRAEALTLLLGSPLFQRR